MGASHYESVLRTTYSSCRKGRRNQTKFIGEHDIKGLPAVIVCGGNFHTLFITPQGGISFHNHDPKELHSSVTMDKLAHEKLSTSQLKGCALLMRGLTDVPRGNAFPDSYRYDIGLSAVFSKVSDILSTVGASRNKLRGASNHKEEGMLDNITKQAASDIKFLKELLNYRKPTDNAWSRGHNFREENPGVPECNDEGVSYEIELSKNTLIPTSASSELWVGKSRYRRESKPTWVRFKAQVNLIWYMKVFKKELAVIDGMLVLEHTKTFPNGLLLLKVVRQGYGFTVNTVPAIYDPIRKKLSWVNVESKAEALESGTKVPRIRRTKAELEASKGPQPIQS